MLSLKLSKWTWELFRLLSKVPFRKREQILSYCGPTLLIIIVTVWVCSFTVGFGLFYWPTLGSGIQSSQGQQPTDLATALYYSGYTLTTLGVGDLVPQNDFWRLVTILEAAVGFSIITASLTYLLSVYISLTKRNAFALSLYHRAAGQPDAVALLVRLRGYGQFEPAEQVISTISRDLLFLLESHHNYPILHYFRFKEVRYSLARMALISLDLATIIKTALQPEQYRSLVSSSALAELEGGALDLLFQITDSFLDQKNLDQPQPKQQWRQRYFTAVQKLQYQGIETVADLEAGADAYVAHREKWDAQVVGL
ncbi:MAG: potassium channel family protein, partial [Nodosilinea sp.]